MKTLIFLSLIILAVATYFGYEHWKKQKRKYSQVEIRLLGEISVGLEQHLVSGQTIPTQWSDMSNMVNWAAVDEICRYNDLPPAPRALTLLAQKVFHKNNPSGFVFLLQTEAFSNPGIGVGRWALAESSNRVVRLWLNEKDLAPEIKAQLSGK